MQNNDSPQSMSFEDWRAEGERRFGKDITKWKFVCPGCGHIASGQDFKDAGAAPNAMYQECIGRYNKGKSWMRMKRGESGPCDYAGYGLIPISPMTVIRDGKKYPVFAFAEVA
jgi:hypothetical protein